MELFTFGIMNSSIRFAASLSSACRLACSSITRSPTVSLVRLSSAAWGKTAYLRNKYLRENSHQLLCFEMHNLLFARDSN